VSEKEVLLTIIAFLVILAFVLGMAVLILATRENLKERALEKSLKFAEDQKANLTGDLKSLHTAAHVIQQDLKALAEKSQALGNACQKHYPKD